MIITKKIGLQYIYQSLPQMRSCLTYGPVCIIMSLLVLLTHVNADIYCNDPQKAYYISYNCLSNLDTMPNLFTMVNSKIGKYNSNYDDGKGKAYSIIDMHPQMYYNQHHQKQIYLDPQHINVTLGDIEFAFRMNYSVTASGQKAKTGWARGRVLVDQTAYFIKRLMIKDGYLQWDPTDITNLTITFPIAIQYSEPTLEYDDKMTFQLLINDHINEKKIKSLIMNDFNANYKTLLKEHLNTEQVLGNLSIKYNYKNIAFTYLNVIKNYTLSTANWKGLEAYFFFQLQNQTHNCTPDIHSFDYEFYGGNQEIYSLSTIRESFKYALTQGLFDVKLDRKWQVPRFQFYMGDLANSVPHARKFPADDPFEVECKWERNLSNVKVLAYDDHEIYAEANQICIISYKAKQILQAQFDMSFVVRVIPEDDTLTFLISSANIFFPTFKSIDPNFVVTDTNLARFAIAGVAAGLNKSTTVGTGFKIGKRKFPSTRFTPNHMVVFDASEY